MADMFVVINSKNKNLNKTYPGPQVRIVVGGQLQQVVGYLQWHRVLRKVLARLCSYCDLFAMQMLERGNVEKGVITCAGDKKSELVETIDGHEAKTSYRWDCRSRPTFCDWRRRRSR